LGFKIRGTTANLLETSSISSNKITNFASLFSVAAVAVNSPDKSEDYDSRSKITSLPLPVQTFEECLQLVETYRSQVVESEYLSLLLHLLLLVQI
jgi:hypothetical protein